MSAKIVGPQAGKAGHLGGIGVRFMAWAAETGGGFSLVEHPMEPRALAAPLHRHTHEDEYSYVLEGRMALKMDDGTEREFGPGDSFHMPPGHDAWIVGDEACVMLDFGGLKGYAQSS